MAMSQVCSNIIQQLQYLAPDEMAKAHIFTMGDDMVRLNFPKQVKDIDICYNEGTDLYDCVVHFGQAYRGKPLELEIYMDAKGRCLYKRGGKSIVKDDLYVDALPLLFGIKRPKFK